MLLSDFAAWFAEQLDGIEAHYGDDADVRMVVLHVEVDGPEDTEILTCSSEDRDWAVKAFMDKAAELITEANPVGDDD